MLQKLRFNENSRIAFAFAYILIATLSNSEEKTISLKYAIEKLSPYSSVCIKEQAFHSKNSLTNHPSSYLLPEINKVHNDQYDIKHSLAEKYKDHVGFIRCLLVEINKQKPSVDWNIINSCSLYEAFTIQKQLKINDNENNIYKEFNTFKIFDDLIRKRLDYSGLSIKDYLSYYNLIANYSISKQSEKEYNLSFDIQPVDILFDSLISTVKIQLHFSTDLSSENKDFILKSAVYQVPYLIIGTDLQTKIKDEIPQIYKKRNLLNTILTLNFK